MTQTVNRNPTIHCMATFDGHSCQRPAVWRVSWSGLGNAAAGGVLRCTQHAQVIERNWPDSYSAEPFTLADAERLLDARLAAFGRGAQPQEGA